MPPLRALVVDDSVVMRRYVTEVLQRDPAIEVVATAANGRIALQKLAHVSPDFVTLDLEMPELDGLSTLRELRRALPRLPVIMLSALTRRGAVSTLDALGAGADDYVTKPDAALSMTAGMDRLAADLLPKVHGLCRRTGTRGWSAAAAGRRDVEAGPEPALVCIATSTGGPNALADIFRLLPQPLSVPVAIVQHMPPMFTASLAERLDRLSPHLRCREARAGDVLRAGTAYLAPGGLHLGLVLNAAGEYVAQLLESPPENSCRPAADVLLRTAAECGLPVLAVVLTGMGQDGLHGCRAVRERKGQVVVQDPATSVVWGMPGSVAEAGLADRVLPLSDIPAEIVRRVARAPLPV